MTLQEIEERVKLSLETLTGVEELYDWRLTHYNILAWEDVQEGCYHLSKEIISESSLKELIKAFRDRSEISYIDFHIKVPEPGVDEFRRMSLLFGPLDPQVRLVPPRTPETRREYRQTRVISAMRLTMEAKQVVSEKLRQQFTWLMIREKNKTPEILATLLNFENYNAYQKKLAPAPAVELIQHRGFEGTVKIATPAPTPMFAPSIVDNSVFEARLAPAPVKSRSRSRQIRVNGHPILPIIGVQEEAPHELPSEIHEEFAAYCQNLYEKAKGN